MRHTCGKNGGTHPIFTPTSRIINGLKIRHCKICNINIWCCSMLTYTYRVNRLLVTQGQIWNVKHKKPKLIWASNMDLGFNQSEAQISYILDLICITRLISNVHPCSQKERPWGWRWSDFLIPPFIRHIQGILGSLVPPCE